MHAQLVDGQWVKGKIRHGQHLVVTTIVRQSKILIPVAALDTAPMGVIPPPLIQCCGNRIVSCSQTLTPREGEGESLVKCYTLSCPSASYEVRPIRLHLYGITYLAVAYPIVNGK